MKKTAAVGEREEKDEVKPILALPKRPGKWPGKYEGRGSKTRKNGLEKEKD